MAESVSTRPPSPTTTQSRPPSVTRWIPTARDSRGASAPNVAKASTGIDVSRPVRGTESASPSRTSGRTGPTATAAGRRLSERASSPTRMSSRPPSRRVTPPSRGSSTRPQSRGEVSSSTMRTARWSETADVRCSPANGVNASSCRTKSIRRCGSAAGTVSPSSTPTTGHGSRSRQSVSSRRAGESGSAFRSPPTMVGRSRSSQHVLDRPHLHAPDRAAGVLEMGVVDVDGRSLDVQRRPQQAALLEAGLVGQAHVLAVEDRVARQRERAVLLPLAVLLDGRAADVGAEGREHVEPDGQLERLVVELGALPVAVDLLEQHDVGAPPLHLADDAVEVVAAVPEPAVDVEAQHRQVARRTGRARRDGRGWRLGRLGRRRGARTATARATATRWSTVAVGEGIGGSRPGRVVRGVTRTTTYAAAATRTAAAQEQQEARAGAPRQRSSRGPRRAGPRSSPAAGRCPRPATTRGDQSRCATVCETSQAACRTSPSRNWPVTCGPGAEWYVAIAVARSRMVVRSPVPTSSVRRRSAGGVAMAATSASATSSM